MIELKIRGSLGILISNIQTDLSLKKTSLIKKATWLNGKVEAAVRGEKVICNKWIKQEANSDAHKLDTQ